MNDAICAFLSFAIYIVHHRLQQQEACS